MLTVARCIAMKPAEILISVVTGNLDVVVTNNQGAAGDFAVLLGLGDGTLSARETIHVPTAALAIAAADFNHDGFQY